MQEMMDKYSIWQTLHDHIQPPKGEDTTLEVADWSAGLTTASEAIAQAHKEDRAKALEMLEAEWKACVKIDATIIKDMQKQIDQLTAQVAVMAEALNWLLASRPLVPDDWWYHQQDRGAWKDAVEKAIEALQSAPKVLFSGKAGIRDVQIGGPFVENSIRRCVVVPMEGDPLRDHGMTVVDAIVLERSVKEGCSPAPEHPKKSEQPAD